MKVPERSAAIRRRLQNIAEGKPAVSMFNSKAKLDPSQVRDRRDSSGIHEILVRPLQDDPDPKRLARATPGMKDFIKYSKH
jgi:hypothetical protein